MASTRRLFMKSLPGIAGAAGLTAKARGGSSLPKGRLSPLDGVTRQNIKIRDLKLISLAYRLKPEEEWADGATNMIIWKTESVIVEVSTDAGLKGIGACSRYNGPAAMKEYLEKVVKPVLVGKNPFDVESLSGGISGRGARGVWAGVDTALWDIIGKAKGLPLYKLLATDTEPQTRIRAYASGGRILVAQGFPVSRAGGPDQAGAGPQGCGLHRLQVPSGRRLRAVRQHPGLHSLRARTEEGGGAEFRPDAGIQPAVVGGAVPGDRAGSRGGSRSCGGRSPPGRTSTTTSRSRRPSSRSRSRVEKP